MATERFTNDALTELSSDVSTIVETSVFVTSDAEFPSSPQFRIKIGEEILLVTAIPSANEFTVVRGVEGTSPGTYSSGASVAHTLTASSFANAIRGDISFSDDSGSANAYVASLEIAPEEYKAGMVVRFNPASGNTGSSTINVNSLGLKTIKKNVSEDLSEGDIAIGKICSVIYDGTNFQLLTFPDLVLGVEPSGSVDGTNATFSMPDSYISNTTIIYRNGLRQKEGDDYSESGSDVIFTSPPKSGDTLLADYKK
jgi:hypothetical protein